MKYWEIIANNPSAAGWTKGDAGPFGTILGSPSNILDECIEILAQSDQSYSLLGNDKTTPSLKEDSPSGRRRVVSRSLIIFAAIGAAQSLVAQSPQARLEDDATVQISREIIRVADSHVEVARALSNAHNKMPAENSVTNVLLHGSERVDLCVTDFGIYLLDAKFLCACPPSSVSSWAERARKQLEVTDKRLDVMYQYGKIVPSDVMTEARSLQRDVQKAIEFCRRVELEFKDK